MRFLYHLVAVFVLTVSVETSVMADGWHEEQLSTAGLHGTLTLPAGDPVATVLIIAGSGPADRDGNLPGMSNNSLKMLAHGLAQAGISSLRTDKRGISRSDIALIKESDIRFGTYVDDAVIWLNFLSGRKKVGALWVAGHSEGALVATLAAKRANVAGLILLAGAGRPAGRLIDAQMQAAGLSAGLLEASRRITVVLENGQKTDDVPTAFQALYRPSVQDYLISWFALDPAAELATIDHPVLIVQGGHDLQIGMEDAQALARALPSARLHVIDAMNHVLKVAPADREGNLATYNMPDLPLAPELVGTIADFIR